MAPCYHLVWCSAHNVVWWHSESPSACWASPEIVIQPTGRETRYKLCLIQCSVWYSVQPDTAFSLIQHSAWYSIQPDTVFSLIQRSAWYSVPHDTAFRMIQRSVWYSVPSDTAFCLMVLYDTVFCLIVFSLIQCSATNILISNVIWTSDYQLYGILLRSVHKTTNSMVSHWDQNTKLPTVWYHNEISPQNY
jgi:hypothetical protein